MITTAEKRADVVDCAHDIARISGQIRSSLVLLQDLGENYSQVTIFNVLQTQAMVDENDLIADVSALHSVLEKYLRYNSGGNQEAR